MLNSLRRHPIVVHFKYARNVTEAGEVSNEIKVMEPVRRLELLVY
jgi:hypothetical protein